MEPNFSSNEEILMQLASFSAKQQIKKLCGALQSEIRRKTLTTEPDIKQRINEEPEREFEDYERNPRVRELQLQADDLPHPVSW